MSVLQGVVVLQVHLLRDDLTSELASNGKYQRASLSAAIIIIVNRASTAIGARWHFVAVAPRCRCEWRWILLSSARPSQKTMR